MPDVLFRFAIPFGLSCCFFENKKFNGVNAPIAGVLLASGKLAHAPSASGQVA